MAQNFDLNAKFKRRAADRSGEGCGWRPRRRACCAPSRQLRRSAARSAQLPPSLCGGPDGHRWAGLLRRPRARCPRCPRGPAPTTKLCRLSPSGPAHILGCRPPMVFWSGVGICHGGFPSHISGIVAANPRFCTGVVEMHNYIYKILHNIQWLYLGKAPHHTRCVPTVPGTRGAWRCKAQYICGRGDRPSSGNRVHL